MKNNILDNERFHLRITDKGLRELLINTGTAKIFSQINSFYKLSFEKYKNLSIDEKNINSESFIKLGQFKKLYDQIVGDKSYFHISSQDQIEKWESSLKDIELPAHKIREIIVCSNLLFDENAILDFNELQHLCHSLKLISTCFLCQNGQFTGDGNYCNNKFVNCLADVPFNTEIYEKCTSFEERERNDE